MLLVISYLSDILSEAKQNGIEPNEEKVLNEILAKVKENDFNNAYLSIRKLMNMPTVKDNYGLGDQLRIIRDKIKSQSRKK